MSDDLRQRTPEEVFDDHLRLVDDHRSEEDIERNIAPDCVILERRGIFHGREGARELAQLLEDELPDAPYVYTNRLIEGRFAFLEWTAEATHTRVRDGADSFVPVSTVALPRTNRASRRSYSLIRQALEVEGVVYDERRVQDTCSR